MDDARFATLARATARRFARRGLLHLGATALAGGFLARPAVGSAGQSCLRPRARCAADAECCSGFCEETRGIGRCACPIGQTRCGHLTCCPPG